MWYFLQELWDVASRFPVYNQLLDLNFYNFQCVQEGGEREELLEERKRISDIRPFCNTLTVVRKAGDAEEKVLNSRIGILIGKSKHNLSSFITMFFIFQQGFIRLKQYKSLSCTPI